MQYPYKKRHLCSVAEAAMPIANASGLSHCEAVMMLADACLAHGAKLYLPNEAWQRNTMRFRRKLPVRDSEKEWEAIKKMAADMDLFAHFDDAPPAARYWQVHALEIQDLVRQECFSKRQTMAMVNWLQARFALTQG